MNRSLKLSQISDRLTQLVVQAASACDHVAAKKYEERLLRCRSLIAQSLSPGF